MSPEHEKIVTEIPALLKFGSVVTGVGAVSFFGVEFAVGYSAPGMLVKEIFEQGHVLQNPIEWNNIDLLEAGIYSSAAVTATGFALMMLAVWIRSHKIAMIPDRKYD